MAEELSRSPQRYYVILAGACHVSPLPAKVDLRITMAKRIPASQNCKLQPHHQLQFNVVFMHNRVRIELLYPG